MLKKSCLFYGACNNASWLKLARKGTMNVNLNAGFQQVEQKTKHFNLVAGVVFKFYNLSHFTAPRGLVRTEQCSKWGKINAFNFEFCSMENLYRQCPCDFFSSWYRKVKMIKHWCW